MKLPHVRRALETAAAFAAKQAAKPASHEYGEATRLVRLLLNALAELDEHD